LRANLLDYIAELVDVFEVSVHRCKSDVSDLVQTLQFPHDQLPHTVAAHLAQALSKQALFDAMDGGIDRLGRDGTLA
jgi:hypothetical protein